jgi:hypothetical protein
LHATISASLWTSKLPAVSSTFPKSEVDYLVAFQALVFAVIIAEAKGGAEAEETRRAQAEAERNRQEDERTSRQPTRARCLSSQTRRPGRHRPSIRRDHQGRLEGRGF